MTEEMVEVRGAGFLDRQGADAEGHDRNTPRGRRDDDPQGEDDGGQVSPLWTAARDPPPVPHITMHLTNHDYLYGDARS